MTITNSEFNCGEYKFTKILGEETGFSVFRTNTENQKQELFLVYPFIDYSNKDKKPILNITPFCSEDRKSSIFEEGQVLCDENNKLITILDQHGMSYFGVWIPIDSLNIDTYLERTLPTSVFYKYSSFKQSIACEFITKYYLNSKTKSLTEKLSITKDKISELTNKGNNIIDKLGDKIFYDEEYEILEDNLNEKNNYKTNQTNKLIKKLSNLK